MTKEQMNITCTTSGMTLEIMNVEKIRQTTREKPSPKATVIKFYEAVATCSWYSPAPPAKRHDPIVTHLVEGRYTS